MDETAKSFLLFGQSQPPPEPVPLRAGPLRLQFGAGDLRYLRLGDREVVRRIYAAVRDRDWDTVPGRVNVLLTDSRADSFRVSFTSTHQQAGIHFVWHGLITGDADGTIRFSFDGEAKTTFLRNRIGFCVLHPAKECAGANCRAHYVNGSTVELKLPDIIAAEQPVKGLRDLAGLAHEVAPDVWTEIEFEGEVFELEDQRNWIDASFKTYCTPTSLPFPVEVKNGARIHQSVTVRLKGGTSTVSSAQTELSPTVTLTASADSARPLPALGLALASHGRPLTALEAARLTRLRLAHLRLDVHASDPNSRKLLEAGGAEAKHLGAGVELALYFDDFGVRESISFLRAIKEQLAAARCTPARVLVLGGERDNGTPFERLALARVELGSLGIPLGVGTNADLYQLNLQRPPAEDADFIFWSMNPQVHAFDNASIAETPEGAAHQVASVRHYFPGKPLVVSPVTLRPRFNPVAAGPDPSVSPGELPPQVDPRQLSLFAASWTIALLAAVAESGAGSVTFYETTGWRGVMESEAGSPVRDKFPSVPGQVFPIYHVFAALADFAGGEAVPCACSDPLRLAALMVRGAERSRLLLGNLSPRELEVFLAPGIQGRLTLRRLHPNTAPDASLNPEAFWSRTAETVPVSASTRLRLGPCELVFLDRQETTP